MRIEDDMQTLKRIIEEDASNLEMMRVRMWMRMRIREQRGWGGPRRSYGQMRQQQADGGGGKIFHYLA